MLKINLIVCDERVLYRIITKDLVHFISILPFIISNSQLFNWPFKSCLSVEIKY